jgi:hypothetical protein
MLKNAELYCCQIIILSIYVPSTHAYIHVLRLSKKTIIITKSTDISLDRQALSASVI